MQSLIARLTFLLFVLGGAACTLPSAEPVPEPGPVPEASSYSLVTANASSETTALYRNLVRLSPDALLFGHQNTTAYGVRWYGEEGRSDVKDITGSYPAVMGWDLGHLELGKQKNLDGIKFQFIINEIKATYKRGGISTLSWHMRNPATGADSWAKTPSIAQLLPGGAHHNKLRANLDAFAQFNSKLEVIDERGVAVAVPIIFRPWHEHNGDWFWWGIGKGLNAEEDYVALWRFTVDYLCKEKGLRNLIFAYSPDRSRLDPAGLATSYELGYPGDAYVDVLGIDNYWDFGHSQNKALRSTQQRQLVQSLEMLADLAADKKKLAAVTEGGQEAVVEADFWTEAVLKGLTATAKTRSISYFMVWRNANKQRENREHFYAPYKGHASEQDFLRFYSSPFTLFEDDLPNLYTHP